MNSVKGTSVDCSHMVYRAQPLFTRLCHLQYLVISSQIQRYGEGLGNLVTCSDVRRIRKKTHGSHCLTACTLNSQLISPQDAAVRPDSAHQWVCHGINKSSYILIMCLFYPKEPAYLGLHTYQNYLAQLCEGLSEMIQSMSPYRPARNTSLLQHSILTTYNHTDTMLTSSLFP